MLALQEHRDIRQWLFYADLKSCENDVNILPGFGNDTRNQIEDILTGGGGIIGRGVLVPTSYVHRICLSSVYHP